MRAALAKATTTALSLAFECTETGAELEPELRDRLTQVLVSAFQDEAQPEHRRLVASVLASRHLRYLVPISTGSICPRPIPSQLYWLFLYETGHPGPDAPCDVSDGAQVSGLWAKDAQAFLLWLNNLALSNSGAQHRLPTSSELGELLAKPGPAANTLRTSVPSAWARGMTQAPGPDRPELWIPPGAVSPHVVAGADLRRAVVQDARRASIMATLLPPAIVAMAFALRTNSGRTLRRAQALDGMVTGARSFRMDLVSARGMQPALELARDVSRALKADTALVVALERALRCHPQLGPQSLSDVETTLVNYRNDRLTEHLEHILSLDRDIAIAMEWHQDLGLTDAMGQLQAVGRGAARCRELIRDYAAHQAVRPTNLFPICNLSGLNASADLTLEVVLGHTLGRACQKALVGTLAQAGVGNAAAAADLDTAFAERLLRVTKCTPERDQTIALDELYPWVKNATTSLLAAHGEDGTTWAAVGAATLERSAGPILTRRVRLNASHATHVRLTSLALTAEADSIQRPDLGSALRAAAAGVTLMQLRARRRANLEALVLARA